MIYIFHLHLDEFIELGIREAMKSVSVGLGQGLVRCNCSGKCANRRCSCYDSKIGCNTKCHPKTAKKCENVKDTLEEIEEECCVEEDEDKEGGGEGGGEEGDELKEDEEV